MGRRGQIVLGGRVRPVVRFDFVVDDGGVAYFLLGEDNTHGFCFCFEFVVLDAM